jgi:phosphoribosyl 1,2-cyclic phosphate phosphodiesterase
MGIPVIGCSCDVCTSTSPFNKRMRPSALLTFGTQNILIDSGPDFRNQALAHRLKTLDGVIYTHAHNDHTAGIDELRAFYMLSHQHLPCLMSNETYQDLRRRFGYIFDAKKEGQLVPRLQLQLLEGARGTTEFLGHQIRYFTFEQAGMGVNGFRFGNLAYVSDIRHYPESIFEDLQGVTHLILSSLRFTPSPMHLSIDESIEFSQKTGAAHTWLTHISHEVDHQKGDNYLPPNVRLAYDGLKFSFGD